MSLPTVLVAVAWRIGADLPASWEHPVVIAVGVVLLGAVAGALAGAYMNHRYWRKQQAYIENREREQQAYVENSLLADRKNERRHQAILEALRAVGPVIANWSAGYKGTMMTGVSTRMEKGPQQVHPMAHDQVAFETALAGLHERLTEAESAVIHRLYDPAEEQIHYYQSVRDLLTSLLG